MADETVPIIEQISLVLGSAQEQKHRQRFYGAMNAFVKAEQLIIGELPAQLRDGARVPSGPTAEQRALTAEALVTSGARLVLLRNFPSFQIRTDSRPEPPSEGDGSSNPVDPHDSATGTAGELLRDWAALNPGSPAPDETVLTNAIRSARNTIAGSLERMSPLPLGSRLDPKDIPVNLAPFYFGDIPLGIADCLVQLGQDYDRALAYYARAEGYPFINPPFEPRDLWLRLAEAYLARGDALYRTGDAAKAVQDYEMVVKHGVPPNSHLYQGMLGGMAGRARAWLRALGADPSAVPAADHPPRHVAALALVQQRVAQISAGLDFLGERADTRPVYSFAYLREIARGYAQFAAQANREYIAFTQRAEDETQNIRQFEQAVALADAGVDIELSRRREAAAEIAAAQAAERLAAQRETLAADNAAHFRRVGWEMVRLDEASAWAGAAAVPDSDEMRQTFRGLDDLGVSGAQRMRSDLVQLLAFERSTRSYGIEVGRLENAVEELKAARIAAAAQTTVAQSRAKTADAAVQAARWRSQFARSNLADAQARETSAELYFDLGNLVRDTARTYLQRAIGAASAMERAYNFENNAQVRRIRLDYGDLSGAGQLYAADFLLRDIDAFLYDHVTSTRSKSQLIIQRVSLRRDYPLQFLDFLKSGTAIFQTTLELFHADMPGTFNGRIKRLGLDFVGIQSGKGIQGRLACAGVSSVRLADGTVVKKVHPSETMIISPLQPEKSFARLDAAALAGIAPAGELAVFENVGLQCSWRLDIPLRSNDVRMTEFADVGLVIAYLCQHDVALEAADIAQLPATGDAEFAIGLRQSGRSANQETFGQLEASGEGEFQLPGDMLPRNIVDSKIRDIVLVCVDKVGKPVPLKVGFWTGTRGDRAKRYSPGANPITTVERSSEPGPFHDQPVPNVYHLSISAADNPLLAHRSDGRALDLSVVNDITVIFSYQHAFR
ncbi:hypothetical protein [Bradyrhizobium sp. AUGA SZCCT0160]|uniref:Tc toxin subunit A-related protein n=1 Tax=Bradyrhizobium sp. AUGA SZCCT0160 TaxID=2807662 RepID=UPI001BAC07A9|nr:hypothetical protein [Bradyrhizobium sp. AUGA SZCCT0160]MBR1188560.1 hypothetical protein [Bradyrhizobium sp. AUGA SZCCT0160]